MNPIYLGDYTLLDSGQRITVRLEIDHEKMGIIAAEAFKNKNKRKVTWHGAVTCIVNERDTNDP